MISESSDQPTAYLVLRGDHRWNDVFRLIGGQVTTIGRAPTNRIVLQDEVCSRNHCEVFLSEGEWFVRDLGSRNGTQVDDTTVKGDFALQSGQLLRIGESILGFTEDISQPLPVIPEDEERMGSETTLHTISAPQERETELEIIHRQRKTQFTSRPSALIGSDRTSRELAKLYRLALEMGQAQTIQEISELVLEVLLAGTNADIGAVLLVPDVSSKLIDPGSLQVVAYHSESEQPYQKVSRQLTEIVLQEHEAVLARDVATDARLEMRDSLGTIQAQSVICAPIRSGEQVQGLLHLYSTDPHSLLEKGDLEYAHAVADQLGVGLKYLREKESLEAGLARVEGENETLREQLGIESELVGESPSIISLKKSIARIAPTDATVLIRGESGVGKELVARAIHFNSTRKKGPFVCMNCAALTETLLESELFGHEKGAFTGASDRKIGKFEQAHNGSLFLDEVGEMGPAIQAKFLRVLEGHPFERVGGGTPVSVDVRVVAATNRNLEQAVEEQKFRADLYFRLHVVQLIIDPLRDRELDIELLANHFLTKFAEKIGRSITGFSPEAMSALLQYSWPGNVRELQNTIERTVILCRGPEVSHTDIQLSHLGTFGSSDDENSPDNRGLGDPSLQNLSYQSVSLEEMEKNHILETLDHTNWNKSKASQILGIERSTLDRKLKKYDVQRPS